MKKGLHWLFFIVIWICAQKVGELYEMNLYTRKAVNILSIIFTILIFFIINKIDFQNFNIYNISLKNEQEVKDLESQNNIQEINPEDIVVPKEKDQNNISENIENEYVTNNVNNTNNLNNHMDQYDWCISIPIIELVAPIEETVEKEVMERSVGHFSNTSKWNGNVGLGAHNRGYKVNYFSNIKKLKRGDVILYKYNGETKQYSVNNIVIIKDTDWSYLENTEENRITLITCVENEPNYRRCIQGIEE